MTITKPDLAKIYQGGLMQGAVSQFINNPVRCYIVRNLDTLNSTAEKINFTINVGKEITRTLKNAKMKKNVLTPKESMPQIIKHVRNGKKKKILKE